MKVAKKEAPATTEERLATLHQRRAAVAGELQLATEAWADKPEDASLQAERAALRDELDLVDVLVGREQAKLEKEAAENTEEARRAKTAAIDAAFERVMTGHAQLLEIDTRLCEHLDAIAVILAERSSVADEQQSSGYSIVRSCAAPGDNPDRLFDPLRSALRQEGARGPLVSRVYASGLGRTGIDMNSFIDVRPVHSDVTLEDVKAKAARSTRFHLRKLIAKRKERLGEQA